MDPLESIAGGPPALCRTDWPLAEDGPTPRAGCRAVAESSRGMGYLSRAPAHRVHLAAEGSQFAAEDCCLALRAPSACCRGIACARNPSAARARRAQGQAAILGSELGTLGGQVHPVCRRAR